MVDELLHQRVLSGHWDVSTLLVTLKPWECRSCILEFVCKHTCFDNLHRISVLVEGINCVPRGYLLPKANTELKWPL